MKTLDPLIVVMRLDYIERTSFQIFETRERLLNCVAMFPILDANLFLVGSYTGLNCEGEGKNDDGNNGGKDDGDDIFSTAGVSLGRDHFALPVDDFDLNYDDFGLNNLNNLNDKTHTSSNNNLN
jgi:hypothetical protein